MMEDTAERLCRGRMWRNGRASGMRMADRVVIVTGAGAGNGKAFALGFAREGADLACVDARAETAEETAGAVRALGRRALALGADVSVAADVERMVRATVAELGRVDVLVNNAGIRLITPLLDISEEEWDRHLDVDLKGPFLCLQAVAKQMLRQGRGGVIINITSTASEEGLPGRAHYCSAKGGLKMLTKVAALELAQYGIRVTAIAPGPIETAMTAMLRETPEQVAAGARRMPLGRWGQPEDLVGAALFLASEEASWVTGINLWVDGGALAGWPGELPSKVAADILAARGSGT